MQFHVPLDMKGPIAMRCLILNSAGLIAAVLMGWFWSFEAAANELPISFPPDQEVVTVLDWSEQKYEFNRGTMIDAYQTHGDRNPKWDEQAIDFLDDVARFFSGLERTNCESKPRGVGSDVIELGCKDPLVIYCSARMMLEGEPSAATTGKAIQMIEEAYPLLVIRGYPANRCFAAADRLRNHYGNLPDDNEHKHAKAKAKKYFDKCWSHSLQMILQDDPSNPGTLVIVDNVMKFFGDIPANVRGNYFFTAKKLEKESPWLVNLIGGELHLDKAWEGRGGGWAYDVTQEGWEEFGDHLQRARNCFTRAWKITPDRPQPAAGMITVAMGSSDHPQQEMQLWFERAVKAQLNYLPAYHRFLRGLMPRWHGSHGTMLQVGRQAVETDRYDTDAPYMLCEAVWRILQDFQNDEGEAFLSQPGLFDEIETVCNRYIEYREEHECDTRWWKTVLLGFCYLTERWDKAKVLLDDLDKELDENALKRFPLQRESVVASVLMHRGPQRDPIGLANQAIEERQFAEAIVQLEALLEHEDLPEDLASLLRDRLQMVRWIVAFESGEEVSLLSGKGLHGWKTVSGKWISRPTGAIRGEAAGEGLLLECTAQFGNHWILGGDLVRGGSSGSKRTAGVYLYDGRSREYSIVFSPTYKWLTFGRLENLDVNEQSFRPKSDVVPFEVHFDDGVIDVWLDHRKMVSGYSLSGYNADQRLQIVLGTVAHYSEAVLTYRNLTIRRPAATN